MADIAAMTVHSNTLSAKYKYGQNSTNLLLEYLPFRKNASKIIRQRKLVDKAPRIDQN
ncbi:hypothetical protein FD07_GL001858 [Levilactobacillus parabrevis ATCC 53295]|uniref:Uncharacterized protein n=1 Tax=Levilactobacillus parabrevis ATCC 53295 TaxID=1267003 RepID=A0A0R1GJ10_9LACO|nr:hypothetical protein FD07_GL001858 [Levilactobacillus parabrevis ATCC 53295]KRO04662.1 hypothetical protein IV61_GL001945 [Levilactobacillus parabrevis]